MKTFAEYERLAKMTQPTNGCDPVEHGAHGMSSELAELADGLLAPNTLVLDLVNVIEEIGDIMWYLVRAAGGVRYSLEDLAFGRRAFADYEQFLFEMEDVKKTPYEMDTIPTLVMHLTGALGPVHDALKRKYAYGQALNVANVSMTCFEMLPLLAMLARCCGVDLERVCKANIAKLSLRNEKLRADPAARDIAAERAAMQKVIA